MPIGNFTKCLSGDLTKVSRNGLYSPEKIREIWSRLFSQHLAAHGLPDNYTQYVNKMVKALDLYAQAYNGAKWKIVKARVYEAEAEQLLKGEGEKIETTCARISKFIGFAVRADVCSVVEFYNYVAIMTTN